MENIALVLEGGALRGIYTAGVLDYFIKHNFFPKYVIGVSAGACQAFSYISKQYGRNKKVTLNYIKDKRYLSKSNLIKKGEIFGFDFMFGDVPRVLVPFDFDTFENSKQEFVVGVTNCSTGRAEYFYKNKGNYDFDQMAKICTASSSLPLFSKPVEIEGNLYMDGGISDSIPIRKAFEDGCKRAVVVLTRNLGYRKKPASISSEVSKHIYNKYTGLYEALKNRHIMYNNTMDYIDELEKEGKAFVIRPSKPVVVGRLERNKKKLFEFYKNGYSDVMEISKNLYEWYYSEVDN